MRCCEKEENMEQLRSYDPQPRNKDGSIRWYLFRWDDGKSGSRRLIKCRVCGALYLVQRYHLNRFSAKKQTLFEDWYPVESERQADHWNRIYTGMELEHSRKPLFRREIGEEKNEQ